MNNVAIEYYGGYNGCSNVNFNIEENSLVCILGLKDSGKSSLLKAIAGLEDYSGSIMYNGQELKSIPMKEREFALSRNKLPRGTSVYNILAYPLKLRKINKVDIKKRVIEVADDFDIFHLLKHTVSMLTPQQKVLIEIARIFMLDRKLYLIDNPLENIYITERASLAAEIIAKIKSLKKTVIYATDMLEEVAALAPNKTMVLCYNQMQDEGNLYEMAKEPKSLAVAKLLWQDLIGVADGEMVSDKLTISSKEYGVHSLMGNGFIAVKCLIGYNAISITSSGEEAEVVAVYKYIDKAIIKINTHMGILYIKTSEDSKIILGDKINFTIDNDKILIYDNNSEKLITR